MFSPLLACLANPPDGNAQSFSSRCTWKMMSCKMKYTHQTKLGQSNQVYNRSWQQSVKHSVCHSCHVKPSTATHFGKWQHYRAHGSEPPQRQMWKAVDQTTSLLFNMPCLGGEPVVKTPIALCAVILTQLATCLDSAGHILGLYQHKEHMIITDCSGPFHSGSACCQG